MTINEAFSVFDMHVLQGGNAKKKTRANYTTAVNSFIRLVGNLDIQFIGIDHIILWKIEMRANGIQATSINTNISRMRSVFKWLREKEFKVLDYRIMERDPEEKNKPKVWCTPEEVEALVKSAKTIRDKALIAMYFGTGCRLSEILNLDRDDFDKAPYNKEHQVYEVWVLGKGDKYRPAWFDDNVKQAIDTYLDTRNDRFKPLFMSNQNRRLGPSRVEKMVHEVTRRSGLDKNITPHTLRHSFVSDLAVNGAPIPAIALAAGHSNANVTLGIYTHLLDKQGMRAYAKHHTPLSVK